MDTKHPELIDRARGELSPDEATALEARLAADAALREEAASVQETLAAAKAALPRPTAPDGFADRVRARIAAECPAKKRSATRRIIPLHEAVTGHIARSWRSMAASILLHAAVLAIVAGAGYWVGTRQFTMPVDMSGQARLHAPRIARTMAEGAIAIADVRPAQAMFLTGDRDGCIWAFPVGGAGNPTEAVFLSRLTGGDEGRLTRVDTSDGVLRVPTALRERYLEGSGDVLLLSLADHIEVWSPERLTAYEAGLAMALEQVETVLARAVPAPARAALLRAALAS